MLETSCAPRLHRLPPFIWIIASLSFATVLPTSLQAQIGTTPTASATEASPAEIELSQPPDTEIARRITRILDQIEEFQNVKVSVSAGVATLSGTALRAKARYEIKDLVSRVEGVVYVNNRIEEETGLQDRVTPAIAKARDTLRWLIRLLPVIGIALVIVILGAWLARGLSEWKAPLRWIGVPPLLRDVAARLAATTLFILCLVLALDLLDATAVV
ncbi:MAG: BON domain-containing protein, partial [Chthoniobacteraceae bacterium]